MRVPVDHGSSTPDPDVQLIVDHYDAFNARRLDDAASQFHSEAPLEHVTGCVQFGPDGFRVFAGRWLEGLPDAELSIQGIQRRSAGLYDVDLLGTGTHTGTLTFGSWVFRPTHHELRLPARQLVQIQDGLIRFATLSLDLQDLVRQLATVDTQKLLQHLASLQHLAEQLASARAPARQREIIDRVGAQLDAARHVVRPYFR